jgi:o-succinylbenzoate synthase
MNFNVKIKPYTLHFKRPAGTSRGVYLDHAVWYVVLRSVVDPDHVGIGECAPLFDLSCDYDENYEKRLKQFAKELEENGEIDYETLKEFPSVLFGFETALRHFEAKSLRLWDTPFSQGKEGIPINGLIWMGDFDYMYRQIEAKLEGGFRCVKLKIGAIEFDKEISLLRHIRQHFSSDIIELRVDANGAFSPEDALEKLKRLSEFELHSIEQPIRQGQWREMQRLVQTSPIPIALDEEMIGVNQTDTKKELLETIMPQYIILKPTLHGGFRGVEEWIGLANSLGIGWWITSALESNVGLNAIAQWCSTLNNSLPQGLGTGGLYTNNIDLPLRIEGDCLWAKIDHSTTIRGIS